MKKLLFVLLFSLLIIGSAFAEIVVKASTRSAVAVGDRFQIEYSVNDKATDIRVDLKEAGLEVLYGPATGSRVSIINGVQSFATTFTYTVIARSEGTYTVPAATVTVAGKPYTSNTVSIKVLSADNSSGSNHNSRQNDRNSQKINTDDVHLELALSKSNAYEGEAIVATLKLYFRNTPIRSISDDVKLPEFDGFTVQELDLGERETSMEKYKDGNFLMYPIMQWVLFPSRSGEIKIPSAYITAIAAVETRRTVTGMLFDYPMDYTTNVEVPIKSNARTVKVSPLPAGKPASYSNGVGDFKINAEITTNKVKANDALIYRVIVEGTGNLKYVNDPQPEFPSDFEVYDPKTDLNAKTTAQGMTGKKVIEYTIVPRHAGNFEIPSIEFSYFDVRSGQYKTLTTQSFPLEVEKGVGGDADNSGSVSNYSGSNQERLKVLGNDIRYIHSFSSDDLHEEEPQFFGTLGYWLFYIIPVVILLILAIVYRRQIKLNADADLRRTRKANKLATRRLKEAAQALKAKKDGDFYEAIHKAMFGYVGDKLSIKLSELTTTNVKEQLAQHGVGEEIIKQYEDIISTCEFARYAPASDAAAMDQFYKQASDCLNNLESQIKK